MSKKEFNGAWEERGVIGTRIEIDEPQITVLWRNSPVLITRFTRIFDGVGTELKLQNRGLRYAAATSDYAEVTRIYIREGKMEFSEFFPVSGGSNAILERTENSRYGDFTIADEILGKLMGEWTDDEGFFKLRFKGDTAETSGRRTRIRVLKPNSGFNGTYKIADANPAVYDVLDFSTLEYSRGTIRATLMVFDAPPEIITLHKK